MEQPLPASQNSCSPSGICHAGCKLPFPLAAPYPCRLAVTAFQVFVAQAKQPSLHTLACWLLSPSGLDRNSNSSLVPSLHLPDGEAAEVVWDTGKRLRVGARPHQSFCQLTTGLGTHLSISLGFSRVI